MYAADLKMIARHELAPKSTGQDLDPNKLHRRPSGRPATDFDQLKNAFDQMGQIASAFFQQLEGSSPRQCAHFARQILVLREFYSTESLIEALEYALSYGAFEARSVERILRARAKPRRLAEFVPEETMSRIAAAEKPHATSPRNLEEYDALPVRDPKKVIS